MKKYVAVWLAIALVVMAAAGCAKKDPYEAVNENIKVDGVLLGQVEKGLPEYLTGGEKENCVYGYELKSVDPEVTIGISGERGTLRKIITAVPEHSIYGVSPGQELSEAEKSLLDAGLKLESGHKYLIENVRVELLSMENTKADRVSVEVVEK